ncbi:MAG: hypothetical protein K2N48_01665 [Muribaculaceae bacterium]|nr:hypothetical protein [Muribaculaceae bacterium]
MKLWIDDLRPAPFGWVWLKTVNEAIVRLKTAKNCGMTIEVISLDHDAGDYFPLGGDYIKVLDWLEQESWSIPINLHSMNPVGVMNMRAIIQKNGWKEV